MTQPTELALQRFDESCATFIRKAYLREEAPVWEAFYKEALEQTEPTVASLNTALRDIKAARPSRQEHYALAASQQPCTS
jgi:hypothetical protein